MMLATFAAASASLMPSTSAKVTPVVFLYNSSPCRSASSRRRPTHAPFFFRR
jgi:hypothetical protein